MRLLVRDGSDDEVAKWDDVYKQPPPSEQGPGMRAYGEELADRLMRLVPDGARVLEAGCGGGWQSLALARTGRYSLTLMDFSPNAISHARALFTREGLEAEFVLGDIFDPDLHGDFDLVFNAGSLEHYDFDAQVQFVRNMGRLSRHYVLVVWPNPRCYWYWLWRLDAASSSLWPFGKEAPMGNMGEVIEAAGLNLIGHAFMADMWMEDNIAGLVNLPLVFKNEIIRLHRTPVIPRAQKAYLIGALASVGASQSLPEWSDEVVAGTGGLDAAVVDALALALAREREVAHTRRDLALLSARLGSCEEETRRLLTASRDRESDLRRRLQDATQRAASQLDGGGVETNEAALLRRELETIHDTLSWRIGHGLVRLIKRGPLLRLIERRESARMRA